jgi:hypothetical protein
VPVNRSSAAGDDRFDPRKLTLTQDFVALAGVRKAVVRVPLLRPPAQAFFWPHPDPEWRTCIAALEIKETRETYIVAPELRDELHGEWVMKLLVTCQTRQGSIYLWPIRLPDSDGRLDSWNESGLQIANDYAGQWFRLVSNREIGAYQPILPMDPVSAPTWTGTFNDLLIKAFRGRVIDSLDHPVVKGLRGIV